MRTRARAREREESAFAVAPVAAQTAPQNHGAPQTRTNRKSNRARAAVHRHDRPVGKTWSGYLMNPAWRISHVEFGAPQRSSFARLVSIDRANGSINLIRRAKQTVMIVSRREATGDGKYDFFKN